MKYEVFQQLNTSERKLQWFWRLKPAKGKAVAHSAMGYDAEAECIESIAQTKAFAAAPVMNITLKKAVEVAPAKTA